MDNNDISTFIERMEEAGDIWEREDVERVYGAISLEEAIHDRMNDLNWFADILSKVINRRGYK